MFFFVLVYIWSHRQSQAARLRWTSPRVERQRTKRFYLQHIYLFHRGRCYCYHLCNTFISAQNWRRRRPPRPQWSRCTYVYLPFWQIFPSKFHQFLIVYWSCCSFSCLLNENIIAFLSSPILKNFKPQIIVVSAGKPFNITLECRTSSTDDILVLYAPNDCHWKLVITFFCWGSPELFPFLSVGNILHRWQCGFTEGPWRETCFELLTLHYCKEWTHFMITHVQGMVARSRNLFYLWYNQNFET